MYNYDFRHVMDHIEVYTDTGQFLFSADNMNEALSELN